MTNPNREGEDVRGDRGEGRVRNGWEICEGDALALLRALPRNSVDAVITDPPYNVGKDYGSGPKADRREGYEAWLGAVLDECARVSRDAVVFFPGTVNILRIAEVLRDTRLRPVRLLGWHKREYAGDKWNGGPAMCWEPIVWASKQERPNYNKIFGWRGRDFLAVDSTHGDPWAKRHPCPKPQPVMDWLVSLFSPVDGKVLDPFAGTGTTGAACMALGRSFLGFELNPDYCELARERIGASLFAQEQPDHA